MSHDRTWELSCDHCGKVYCDCDRYTEKSTKTYKRKKKNTTSRETPRPRKAWGIISGATNKLEPIAWSEKRLAQLGCTSTSFGTVDRVVPVLITAAKK
jgi:hypothetical protein